MRKPLLAFAGTPLTWAMACTSALALSACQQQDAPQPQAQNAAVAAVDAPQDGENRQLLWGDTHVHSMNSTDAFWNGNDAADIDTAYRFARGLPVLHPRTGAKVRIDRPLDFMVMADHAEFLSVSRRMSQNDPAVMATPSGRWMKKIFTEQGGAALARALIWMDEPGINPIGDLNVPSIRQPGWDYQVDAAERYNEPGKFTALIGWEWSSTPGGKNLHRIVFTNADGEKAKQFLPFNYYISDRPEDLWKYLQATRDRTGADFVAMPHNSNLSGGLMFRPLDTDGNPFTADYSRTRAAWEPVVEITQYKGTSETHPALSPRDEFADFELRTALLSGQKTDPSTADHVRSALKTGLAEEARTGVNPFQFGVIGASDSHTGFTSVVEDDFMGKMGVDYLPRERANIVGRVVFPAWEMSASGLAGVWADGNDRQSLFDAFRRREVYGTSGPRISVRLFAGYDFAAGDAERKDFARNGYRLGVPMGSVLAPSSGKAPRLAIRAVKDPRDGNLDRVQVVKGWLGRDGRLHEKVYDVAWSGNRRIGADGKLPAVGNTVDVASGRYTNTIGAPELATVWTDPDFDAAQPAFYYVRVLQIPTPRHSLFDALALGMDPKDTGRPLTIQDRAWSSPVWYRP